MSDDIPSFGPTQKNDNDDTIHDEVDQALHDLMLQDKIRLANEVKENPPRPGEMQVEIPDNVYALDLDTLLNAQLNDCPATVIPMLIDHGVRTAVDIKNAYRPEKRIIDFKYWWIFFLIIGIIAMFFIANLIFGG